MSLILEALKKVERERTTPEQRGFLVLGPAAWAPARSNAGWIVGIVAAAGLAGGIVYLLTRPQAVAPRADERLPPDVAAPAEAAPAAHAEDWRPLPQTMPSRPRPAAAAPAVSAPPAPVLLLHAISEQDGVPIAVVNDRVVREGDTFGAVRILRIGAAEVEVEVAGARRILRF